MRKLIGGFGETFNYKVVIHWTPQEADPKKTSLEKGASDMEKRRKPVKCIL